MVFELLHVVANYIIKLSIKGIFTQSIEQFWYQSWIKIKFDHNRGSI